MEVFTERYYDDRAKKFYELKMGSMTDDEYIDRFLELYIYVPYLKEEKAKVWRFISGLSLVYTDHINFDDPILLEEVV